MSRSIYAASSCCQLFQPLKEALDIAAKNKRSPIILTTMDGTPWTSDGFRASWGKACAKAGVGYAKRCMEAETGTNSCDGLRHMRGAAPPAVSKTLL